MPSVSRPSKATAYNQTVNVFWSLICLGPLGYFCYIHLELKWLWIFLAFSVPAVLLPEAFYDAIQWSRRTEDYERIGIRFLRKFTQDGDLVNRKLRQRDPGYKTFDNPAKLQQLVQKTYVFEKVHLAMLLFFLYTAVYALDKRLTVWALALTAANILFNIYPNLLQQYNRLRLRQILKRGIRMLSWSALLVFFGGSVRADTFTVTSNADSGPGTLRDAITQAAANGSSVRDSIIFALTDISEAGRTINLLSALPVLSSNMVINGVSQPGAAIGVSDARILLYHGNINEDFKFLEIHDCGDIGIYGLAMINIANFTGPIVAGVSYVRSHNIQIGRPGAGNYIFGCSHSIYSNTTRYGNYIYADTSRLLILQSNIMGLDMTGGFSNLYNGIQPTLNIYSLYLLNTADIYIGGDDPAAGNTIVRGVSIPFNYPGGSGACINIETYRNENMGQLLMKNNRFGTRKDGTLDPNYRLFFVQMMIYGSYRATYDIQIQNNMLNGNIWMYDIGNYFKIQGNTIFTPWINNVYDCAITIMSCPGGGIIGGDGPGEANSISNAYTDTVDYFIDHTQWEASIRYDLYSHVTIRRNITLCNAYRGSTIMNDDVGSYYNTYAFVRIDYTGVNVVKGMATPNTRVDVYVDDDCPACEGKKYLGFTMANADSSWTYTGNFNEAVVATSTSMLNGQTSPFSTPEIQDYWVRVKQPSCGKNSGFVKGMQVNGHDNVKWHYLYKKNGVWADSIYATTVDLVNAGPGIYFFDAWLGKNCRSVYKRYDLYDTRPTVDSSYISRQSPSCGQFNGFIKGLWLPSPLDIGVYWKNENGTIVSRTLDLTDAGPGKYKLVFQDTVSGCTDSTGVYELKNLSGPTVDIGNIMITAAVCKQSNGSIGNIQYLNVIGSAWYQWLDEKDKAVGNAPSLANVPAGKYRLRFKDGGPCDTITTPVFTVGSDGAILFDSSALVISPSKCSGSTGSILGLHVANGLTYTWVGEPGRIPAGADADLTNIGPGDYRLIATSAMGCVDSTRLFTVPRTAITPLFVGAFTAKQEVCTGKNGLLRIDNLFPDATGYTFQWVDSSTQQPMSTGLEIKDISAGTYYCYATDPNGCTQLFWTPRLINYPAPAIDISSATPYPDTCELSVGGISHIKVSGTLPLSYDWYDDAGQHAPSSSPDLSGVGSGNYYLQVSDLNGCGSKSPVYAVGETAAVLSPPQYPVIYTVKNTKVQLSVSNPENGSYELYADLNSPLPDQQNKTGNFETGLLTNDTTIYVLLRKGTCTSARGPVTIKILETLELIVPNAFTPNSDGHNDLFRVRNPGLIKTWEMQVFDRWGQKVFTGKDPFTGWDGALNGRPLPSGNYVWIAHFTDILGHRREQGGSVLLVR